MSLEKYFENLIARVESSDEIKNNGKDKDGFFKPTRTLVLRHLQVLRDLHGQSRAKPMLQDSWKFVVEHVPPEWLILSAEEKIALQKIVK